MSDQLPAWKAPGADGGKLAAGAVAILLAVGALYATLQSQF